MELNSFQQKVVNAALKTSAPCKHSATSAIRHLERSWQLIDTMPEVAGFLAITAEEEAATAVFQALKQRKYEGAEKINFKNHRVKNALYPFLLAIHKRFKPVFDDYEIQFFFDPNYPEGKQPFRVGMVIAVGSDTKQVAMPHPPLQILSVHKNGTPIDYKKEFGEVASEKGFANITKYIETVANQRNLLLYASPQKIPTLKDAHQFLLDKHNVVFILLSLLLLIEPHKPIQHLPQEALKTFLDVLSRDKPNACAERGSKEEP